MALTPEGRRLTEQHRLAQQQVRDDFLAEFLAIWALLDTARLDETGTGWVQAVMRLIELFRLRSAQVATGYYLDFRAVEAPPEPPEPVSQPSSRGVSASPRPRRAASRPSPLVIPEPRSSLVRFDFDESAFAPTERRTARIELDVPDIDWSARDRAAEVSLIVTGPVGQKAKIGRGKRPQQARDESFVEASGAASRHVLTGGRQSLLRLIEDDEPLQLRGYIRVTDGDPCYFCAMLASRGPVFPSERAAGGSNRRGPRNARAGVEFVGDGEFKVHDHCACTVEPVYYTDTVWPGRAREFRDLWDDHIKNNYSGDDAIRAWRRLYEQRQREARREQVA